MLKEKIFILRDKNEAELNIMLGNEKDIDGVKDRFRWSIQSITPMVVKDDSNITPYAIVHLAYVADL